MSDAQWGGFFSKAAEGRCNGGARWDSCKVGFPLGIAPLCRNAESAVGLSGALGSSSSCAARGAAPRAGFGQKSSFVFFFFKKKEKVYLNTPLLFKIPVKKKNPQSGFCSRECKALMCSQVFPPAVVPMEMLSHTHASLLQHRSWPLSLITASESRSRQHQSLSE